MEITEDQIRTAAREVYHEVGPKFTYKDVLPGWEPGGMACVYTQHGEDGKVVPSCIVGRILHKCGVPLDVMTLCGGGIGALYSHLARGGIILPDSLYDALMNAQVRQDAGKPWHEALTESGLVVL